MSKIRITKEYKDRSGEFRLTQYATNGKITHSSTEGYKNRIDLETNEINSSIAIIEFYKDKVNATQLTELNSAILDIFSRINSED